MQKTYRTKMTKANGNGNGNGVAPGPHEADIRAFLDWWNEKSFLPSRETDAMPTKAPDHAQAA